MPTKTNKYNSACEKNLHTNQPHMFVLHVARCKTCQEKLPGELLETLEPDLSKLRQSVAKRQAEADGKAPPTQLVKVEKKTSPRLKPPEPKPEKVVVKPHPVKPGQPVDPLDVKIRELPSIKGLAKTIVAMKADVGRISARVSTEIKAQGEEFKALGERIEIMLGMGGAVAGDTPKEGGAEDESIKDGEKGLPLETQPKIPPAVNKQAIEPVTGGERVIVTAEMKREAEEIRGELGGDNRPPLESERPVERVSMREGEVKAPPVQEEATVKAPVQKPRSATTSSMAGVPDLESPEQIATMEGYLSQQKKKLGMGEGGGMEAPGEKGEGGFLGSATELVGKVVEVLQHLPKKKEEGGGDAQTMMGDLFKQLFTAQLQKKDPIEYLVQGIQLGNASGGGKKEPAEYMSDGMKLGNQIMANAIKVVSGKGVISPSPSIEDMETVAKRVVQNLITPAKTEHLPTEKTGE